MNKEMKSHIAFYDFMQWLSKDENVQRNGYILKAFVTYETNKDDYSFYNEEQTVLVTTDSQKGGSIVFPDIDSDMYFPGFDVIFQDFVFDEKKEELVIRSRKPSNYKAFSTYCVTIRNMKKIN